MKPLFVSFSLISGGHQHTLTCTYTHPSQLYHAMNVFAAGMNGATFNLLRAMTYEVTGSYTLLAFTNFLHKHISKPTIK